MASQEAAELAHKLFEDECFPEHWGGHCGACKRAARLIEEWLAKRDAALKSVDAALANQ